MLKIDSHQHFWQYHPVKDSWITEDMAIIQKDFLPDDLYPVLTENNIAGCVAVQAAQSEEENRFLIQLAQANPFIKGIVGWVDLQADDVEAKLQHYQQQGIIKGFRHILQAEADERFMLNDRFQQGISKLHKHGFTYDILIRPGHLPYAHELIKNFPDQRFVIDHMAKPNISTQSIDQWQKDIEAVAQHTNVYCKVSGFCTEANWLHWQPADIEPYLDVVFKAFGINRIMYGSDWPVCLLAGGYSKTLHCMENYVSRFSDTQQNMFWSANAIDFYRLNN